MPHRWILPQGVLVLCGKRGYTSGSGIIPRRLSVGETGGETVGKLRAPWGACAALGSPGPGGAPGAPTSQNTGLKGQQRGEKS